MKICFIIISQEPILRRFGKKIPGRKGILFGISVKIFAKQLCYVKGVGLLDHKLFKAGTTSPPACILSRQWGLTLSRHLLDRYLRNQILKIHRYHNTHF